MAIKTLFQTALSDIVNNAADRKDNLGELRYEDDGKVYRFVKNISATALVRDWACLKALTSNPDKLNWNVRSVDTTTAATAQLSIPAGVPQTAIAKSGSTGTGDCGWIQVAGPARVTMVVSDTANAASGWPGRIAICTNLPATANWDVPESTSANSASTGYLYVRGVRMVAKMAEGTASNARSAAVEVMCL